MDAFLVSSLVKNSLKNKKSKKLEHAAFLINDESSINRTTKNNIKLSDNSMTDNSINDNSINDNSIISEEDNYRFSDSGDKIYAPTDNSSNITVNNIKVSRSKKAEEYDDDEDDYEDEYENNNKANNISSVTFLLMLIINSYSAYLSWECNSNKNYPLVLKVVFSFFAFMFGSLYLLYYILFRFDDCNNF
jgi:hypothetical protein